MGLRKGKEGKGASKSRDTTMYFLFLLSVVAVVPVEGFAESFERAEVAMENVGVALASAGVRLVPAAERTVVVAPG